MTSKKVKILDFGSQFTQLIARRIRESKVYCEIIPCYSDYDQHFSDDIGAIILAGGPASVLDQDRPEFDPRWLESNLPTLGICYGMQLLAKSLGGQVHASQNREYGHAPLKILDNQNLFKNLDLDRSLSVWMSHGDHVSSLPDGFEILASSNSIEIAAIGNVERNLYGVQFHAEVVHTESGTQIIENFLFEIAGLSPDWDAENLITSITSDVQKQVAADDLVICGLSGGVDSTVAAILLNQAIPGQLKCIFVDNGLLRKNEAEQVYKRLGPDGFGLDLKVVDAKDEFLGKLAGISEPEQKRKIIGNVFIEVFEREAKQFSNIKYLVQGTLYPDVIESESVRGPSATIKSHHNVGGLPEKMNLKLIEPFRELFKDEVREIGRALGVASEIVNRQPFPGPGLAVRILGEITANKIEMLQNADSIVQDEIRKADLYNSIWQSFAVLLPVNSVGVMGDNRTYEQCVAIRAVHSQDGMTADWCYLPQEVLRSISNRIINEVTGVNRVVLDISSKPPATIEWE